MSKRNFILLIIVLILILAGFFTFLFFRGSGTGTDEGGGAANFLSQFNPFGGGRVQPGTTGTTPVDISGGESTPEGSELELLKISSVPVAGYTIFQKERYKEVTAPAADSAAPEGVVAPLATEFAAAVRYVDRITGNIYQTFADKVEERRFSSTSIPKVQEAFFGGKGESVIMRYLKPDGRTIETFVGNLPKEVLGGDAAGDSEIRGIFLPANITDLSVSPDGSRAFYMLDIGENTIGTTYEFVNGKKTQVFDSAFNEWLSQWNGTGISLTTKPSFVAPGYLYALDTTRKATTQVLGGIYGLTTLRSPDGSMVLYANNSLALSLYHVDSKITEPLGVRTLPEKCAWGQKSDALYCLVPKLIIGTGYPDAWYQGEISFDDQIWKIDVATGSASILIDPAVVGAGEAVDGIKLALDENEEYLFFINKKDSFLWKLNLTKN